MSQLYSIVYQTEKSNEEEMPYHYKRTPAQYVTLVHDHGIEGDLKAGHNPDRHLNIMSYEILAQLKEQGYMVAPGEMGEQLIFQNMDVDGLPIGSRVQIGADAIIEITKPRTGCEWFQKIQGKPPVKTMGMMARVVAGGVIAVGDSITVLQPAKA